MMLKFKIVILCAVCLLPSIKAHASTTCNRSCGVVSPKDLPWPFGFSAGCQIRLNCTADGAIFIDEFRVQSVNSESVLISIPAKCDRPIQSLRYLFGRNYAPTWRNLILLQNCSSPIQSCILPNTMVESHLEPADCGSENYNISCYSERSNKIMFIDYANLTRTRCESLFSAISTESFGNRSTESLDVQVVELGWWLQGNCYCAVNAKCILVEAQRGYRCQCVEGFVGDGYPSSFGCRRGSGSKLLIEVAIGTSVAVVAITIILFCYFWGFKSMICRNKKTKDHEDIEALLKKYGPLVPERYRYSDIKKMTNSFIDKLGQGGYGDVYKGKLQDGRLVAVKILNESKGNGEEFVNEVASISRTSHVNIVTLLGFCFEGPKRALIYEFMPNGSLEKFIYNEKSLVVRQLGWETLYQIALGIARGLEYLHRGCNMRILHFDIKPHNILLDEEFSPKISDFGLAKLCPEKGSVVSMSGMRGTPGYIAPEVFSRNFGGVSHKSDVYSYGMMILEMVGGTNNPYEGVDQSSEKYFPDWIYKRLELDEEIGVNEITNEEENETKRKMIIVGLWCIQTDPSNRPSMRRVLDMLEGSLESLQIPPRPVLVSPPKHQADSSATQSMQLI